MESFPPPPKRNQPEVRLNTNEGLNWTKERIDSAISGFFQQMFRNGERLRAERERLLEQAIKESKEREKAEREIAEREEIEVAKERREKSQESDEAPEERLFRHTIDWMVEQSTDAKDVALRFLEDSHGTNK